MSIIKVLIEELEAQGTRMAGIVEGAELVKGICPRSEGTQKWDVFLMGILETDHKGRFTDDSTILTSAINEIVYYPLVNATLVSTRNSTYIVRDNWLEQSGFSCGNLDANTISELIESDDILVSMRPY
jgi:hypothetical protein